MKVSNTSDPWNRRKTEIDPWDSPWRRKHEKVLAASLSGEEDAFGLPRRKEEDDCAFGLPDHHAKRRERAPFSRSSPVFRPAEGSKNGRNTRALSVLFVALFTIFIILCIAVPLLANFAPHHISYHIYRLLFSLLEWLPFLFFLVFAVVIAKNRAKK